MIAILHPLLFVKNMWVYKPSPIITNIIFDDVPKNKKCKKIFLVGLNASSDLYLELP